MINGIEEKLHDRIVAKVGPPIGARYLSRLTLQSKCISGLQLEASRGLFGASGRTVKWRLKEAALI